MECPTTGTTSEIAQLVMSLVFAFGVGGYLGGNFCEISYLGHSQRALGLGSILIFACMKFMTGRH
jgi:hypothetical protein